MKYWNLYKWKWKLTGTDIKKCSLKIYFKKHAQRYYFIFIFYKIGLEDQQKLNFLSVKLIIELGKINFLWNA